MYRVKEKFCMSPEEVVDIFLKINKEWFSDKENSLYGKRAAIKKILLYRAKYGEEPPRKLEYCEVYVMNKFEKEWLEVYFERA